MKSSPPSLLIAIAEKDKGKGMKSHSPFMPKPKSSYGGGEKSMKPDPEGSTDIEESLGLELADAVKAGDGMGIYSTMEAIIRHCESKSHDEGGEDEDEKDAY